MNRAAFERLVAEDIAWVESQPRTLERDHVIDILRDASRLYYTVDHNTASKVTAEQIETLRQAAEALERAAGLPTERELVRALISQLPKCLGLWLSGSGGHVVYSHDCHEPATTWDPESCVDNDLQCDRHLATVHPVHHKFRQDLDYAPALRALLERMRGGMRPWPRTMGAAGMSEILLSVEDCLEMYRRIDPWSLDLILEDSRAAPGIINDIGDGQAEG